MSFFKPDILISDICLPDEDGYSLLLKVRNLEAKRGRKIPAIALTASAFAEDRKRALLAGYDRYECKPIDIDEFASMVASLRNSNNRFDIFAHKRETCKQESFN